MTPRLLRSVDANWVLGTLWQGSAPRLTPELESVVHVVVLAAHEYQPKWRSRVRVVRVPIDDTGVALTGADVRAVANAAVKVRKALDRGETVLVTCVAGLNRSGLVSALALMLPSRGWRTPGSLTAAQAVAAVRRARGAGALSSRPFLHVLERFESLWAGRCVV